MFQALGMSRRQSPGVSTPWDGVSPLPCKVPPRAGTTYAYLSWFVFVIELNRLPGKPGVNLTHVILSEGLLIPS
jgi:hypothetical protein